MSQLEIAVDNNDVNQNTLTTENQQEQTDQAACATQLGLNAVQLPQIIPPYNQNSDVDIPGSCAICSITFAINIAAAVSISRNNNSQLLDNTTTTTSVEQPISSKRSVTLESVLDLAISNEHFSTRGNGTHPKGCVEIGKLFGNVEWGYFGGGGENKNGFELIRSKLSMGLPVVVGVKMNLFTKPSDIGHAVVIVGIDEKNRVTIADSFSRIAARQGIRKNFPYGKPLWIIKPGYYVAEWEEFDASWNNKDDYMSMSYEGDPAFVNFDPNEEDYRFWMTIDPDSVLL